MAQPQSDTPTQPLLQKGEKTKTGEMKPRTVTLTELENSVAKLKSELQAKNKLIKQQQRTQKPDDLEAQLRANGRRGRILTRKLREKREERRQQDLSDPDVLPRFIQMYARGAFNPGNRALTYIQAMFAKEKKYHDGKILDRSAYTVTHFSRG
jgi:hypothetical protein